MPKQRKWLIAATALVLVCFVTLAVAAKYIKASNVLSNAFVPAPYGNPSIEEDLLMDDADGFKYKTNVAVQTDATDYAVYVRLALILTWQDGSGRVYGEQPFLGTDYTLVYNTTNWRYDSTSGYYYCTAPVDSNTLSPYFMDAAQGQMLKQIQAGPEGYTLHVEIQAQTIQAVGVTDTGTPVEPAIYDAWGIDPAVFS